MFKKLIASDEAVKALFDHFRNIAIAGTVLAAGAWTLQHPQAGRMMGYMSLASGLAMIIAAFFLLVVAERHGRKMFTKVDIPWYWHLLITTTYSLTLLSLFTNLAFRI
jgi:hypothetical protein